MKILNILKLACTIACCTLILIACGEEHKIGLDISDGIAPSSPTNIEVENTYGGAIISYKAPKDNDLLCVVASYEINGIKRTTKGSPYVDKLKVEGFMEGEYEVQLTSIDKSNNESEPVSVTINPLTPPVKLIFESLKAVSSFGGIKLAWENKGEENIIVEVFLESEDEWLSLENFYSNAEEGKATIRNLEPEPIKMKFRVRDRWDNYSDYMVDEFLPLAETQMEKSRFREVTPLPGDSPAMGSLPIRNIWDGNTVSACYHGTSDDIGRTITFDMGVKARISRFKMWQRTEAQAWIYSHNNLKRYVIYGCNEITEAMRNSGTEIDGLIYPTFEGWTKIMDVETYKPSGDNGKVTNEDKEYILNGDDQEIPIEAPEFRYVRIHMLENWSGGTIAQIGEMTFWGQIKE